MNKRNLIKCILVLISLILIVWFQIKIEDIGFVFLIPFLFIITNYMYKYKDNIKKFKFIYDVILMMLLFSCLLLGLYIIIVQFDSLESIIDIPVAFIYLINLYFIIKIFIDSLINLKKETNKLNDYMIIISFIIINLIYIRYHFNISLIITPTLENSIFIKQNYIYFFIMLLVIEIHNYLTNKLTSKI